MKEVWQWTTEQFEDADKMSSPLQGATMKFLAEHQQAKRSKAFLLRTNSIFDYLRLTKYSP